MKFSEPSSWTKNFDYDGLLYFAQRIEEMLFHYSIDLYKVPVLNTNQLIKEYLETNIKVQQGIVKEWYLNTIMNEFKNSFQNDIVLKKYWGQQNIDRILNAINTSNLLDKAKYMDYIRHIISRKYYDWCTEYLKFIIPQQKQKKKIEQALKSFLPELICKGYTSDYIYIYSHEIFFKNKVESINSLNIFLERFDFKKRNFKVYFGLSKYILKFKEILEKRIPACFEDDGNFDKLKIPKDNIIAYIEVDSLDNYSAIKRAYSKFDLFFKFYKYIGHKNASPISKMAMVFDNEVNAFSFLPAIPLGYNFIEEYDSDTAGDYAEMFITRLLGNAKDEFQMLQKAVDLHNVALSSRDFESGFLNLWSVIEVLCIPNQSESKINDIIKILVPILQKDYFLSLFFDLKEKLSKIMSSRDYKDLLDSVKEDLSEAEKIACFVLLSKYDSLRTKYYSNLIDYPVIRSRIYELSDIGKSKRTFYQITEKYRERVEWHIRRIYRIRNGIIHSGETPRNIKAIGEHLHSYVDNLMNEIISKLSAYSELSSVENVLIDTNFAIQQFLTSLKLMVVLTN